MVISRRTFIEQSLSLGAATLLSGCVGNFRSLRSIRTETGPIEVNDIQSQLNRTVVRSLYYPSSTDEVARIVWEAKRGGESVAVCGGRHSMGGQQFATNTPLIDTTELSELISFDAKEGTVTVQAGIQWPALIEKLHALQGDAADLWTIREKQTGVDLVSLGGSIASNVHGRGLTAPPIVSDIESIRVVMADGEIVNASRHENSELFSLVCGGYGLFGVVTEVTLRLTRRKKVKRYVEIIGIKDLLDKVSNRIAEGFLYGDCQYAVDIQRDAGSYPGVFSCYLPVPNDTPLSPAAKKMTAEEWGALYALLRRDKGEAFKQYSRFYLGTNEQVYWSDTHQLAGDFFRGYKDSRDRLGGSELILEVYVSPDNFLDFMVAARKDFLDRGADVTFGTIRFIKRDNETFLAWAREDLVCIVCNLHVVHTSAGVAKVAADFRSLIDQVLKFSGRYYLTYHRFARPDQLMKAYPQFKDFLQLKKKYDPEERFQSDWYRHYRDAV